MTQTAVQCLEVLSYRNVVAPSTVYVQADTSTLSPTLHHSVPIQTNRRSEAINIQRRVQLHVSQPSLSKHHDTGISEFM